MLKARLEITEQMDRMMDRLNETRSAGRGCQPVLRMTASGTPATINKGQSQSALPR
jgi:hypothetical protein